VRNRAVASATAFNAYPSNFGLRGRGMDAKNFFVKKFSALSKNFKLTK